MNSYMRGRYDLTVITKTQLSISPYITEVKPNTKPLLACMT